MRTVPAQPPATVDEDGEYRVLADQVIKWFNPRDDDTAELAICCEAVKVAARYIEALPCTCDPAAGWPHFHVDPCGRCRALGRAADEGLEQ